MYLIIIVRLFKVEKNKIHNGGACVLFLIKDVTKTNTKRFNFCYLLVSSSLSIENFLENQQFQNAFWWAQQKCLISHFKLPSRAQPCSFKCTNNGREKKVIRNTLNPLYPLFNCWYTFDTFMGGRKRNIGVDEKENEKKIWKKIKFTRR